MNILTNLNLSKNELQYAVIHPLASAPAGQAKAGQIYYNSTDKMVYFYDGTKWAPIGVAYSQESSTSKVVTGLAADGTVTVTDVADLIVSGEKTVADIASEAASAQEDATQALSDAADAAEAASTAQGEVDDLEEVVAGLKAIVDGLTAAAEGGLNYQIVTALPDLENISEEDFAALTKGVVYLVLNNEAGENNIYNEYLFIKGDTAENSKFELIGTTRCDLTDYVSKDELKNGEVEMDISDATVELPAPTEADPDAKTAKDLSDVLEDMLDAIEAAQSAADDAATAASNAQNSVDGLSASSFIKVATATIAAGQTEATASFTLSDGQTATVMNVLTTDGANIVYTDAEISATGVKFSIADTYTNAITCKVFYYI